MLTVILLDYILELAPNGELRKVIKKVGTVILVKPILFGAHGDSDVSDL